MSKGRVLVVDDIPDVRVTLSGLLSDEGYDVRSAPSKEEALRMMAAERFDVAVLDARLDDTDEDNRDGLLLMHEIKELDPATAIIILTGYADVQMVRDALQPNAQGIAPAFGFLEKSELDQLLAYVDRAFEHTMLNDQPQVADLIAQGESERVEFKSSMRWDYKRNQVNKDLQEMIAKSIAGMLNQAGGYLLIGVTDDGEILGLDKDLQTLPKPDNDRFQLVLTDIVTTHLGMEVVSYIHPHFEDVGEKCICVVAIRHSPRPVFLVKGDVYQFWVRMGNSTRGLDVKAATRYIQEKWGRVE
ncbi:MAG TPA: response regulator [Chloroflexi bacterium]|nr:response regulator [Chloroflexota bacterium]